jgi:hypothetical protein
MMHEIMKPYFNKYALSNNILQEGHNKAKVDQFGYLKEDVQNAYAIAKAIDEMGHTVNLIFTDRSKTMKTVNALDLKRKWTGRRQTSKA